MMLKTSSNKNSTLGLFLFTIKQNIGLIILTVIGMLLICPGYVMIELNEYHDRLSKEFYSFNSGLIVFGICACIAAAIGVVVYNIINFSYLYSKKSSDVFHAIPLKRTELLLSRSLAGFVSTLIPLIVGYISITCIAVFTPWIIADLRILAVFFMYNIFIMLIAWSMSLLFLICAGTVFDFVLSIGIVNISLLLLPHIFSVFAEEYLFGYTYSFVERMMKFFSPIYFYAFYLDDFVERAEQYYLGNLLEKPALFNSNEVKVLIVSILLISVLTALTVFLYKRRAAEKAGCAYAFKFIYIISNLLLSFEVGFGVGMIFSSYTFSPAFWVFSTAGTLLAAVTFGAISERGFKGYKKCLIVGGISSLALVILTISFAVDITGFEKRIPKNDDILIAHANIEGFTIPLSGDDIALVTDLHEKILNENDIAIHEMEDTQGPYQVTHANLVYKLKNGVTVERSYYSLPLAYYSDDILEICKNEEVVSVITQIKAEKPKNIRFSGVNRETEIYVEYSITKDDFINLLEIYDRDNDKMDKTIFESNSNFYASWDSEFPSGSSRDSGYYDFCVGNNYTEFLAAVEALEEKYQNLTDEKYYD